MLEKNTDGLRLIGRALLSVSDKTGIVEFASTLKQFDVEIISTGGTAKILRAAGIDVREVSDVTGFPEMMNGRIKTLHPRVHGGLLALRDNPEHVAAMNEHGIAPIDLVVVNLYPFQETIAQADVSKEEAIEQIDIGGPSMIRSAAKNFRDVVVVVNPNRYELVLHEMMSNEGSTTLELRQELAAAAFLNTAAYDGVIADYFNRPETVEHPPEAGADTFLDTDAVVLSKITDLRYGENPHQKAALYRTDDPSRTPQIKEADGLTGAALLAGKEMSFNNYVDADAAWQLVSDFDKTACAIIKHTNPAGVGLGATAAEAYRRALSTDPISAFGGIVAFNCAVDEAAAQEVTKIFTEVVIAPDYDGAALQILQGKKNLRVMRISRVDQSDGLEYRQISGGMLVQTRDNHKLKQEELKFVTSRPPTEEETQALLFAWIICKHTKSNAIIYARSNQAVGVGAGQMSRIDSVRIGAMRAQLPLEGCVLASDAFFPFRDGVDEAAKHGITAIIQPGGSVRDNEVIAAANEHGLAMVFTGIRHFKH